MTNPKHMILGIDFLMGDLMEDPPVCPEGFERAEDNEFILLKTLPKCDCRGVTYTEKACCGKLKQILCEREKTIVTRKECLDCNVTIVATGG